MRRPRALVTLFLAFCRCRVHAASLRGARALQPQEAYERIPEAEAHFRFEILIEQTVDVAEEEALEGGPEAVETLEVEPDKESLVCIEMTIVHYMPTIAEKFLAMEDTGGVFVPEDETWGEVKKVIYKPDHGTHGKEVSVRNTGDKEVVFVSNEWLSVHEEGTSETTSGTGEVDVVHHTSDGGKGDHETEPLENTPEKTDEIPNDTGDHETNSTKKNGTSEKNSEKTDEAPYDTPSETRDRTSDRQPEGEADTPEPTRGGDSVTASSLTKGQTNVPNQVDSRPSNTSGEEEQSQPPPKPLDPGVESQGVVYSAPKPGRKQKKPAPSDEKNPTPPVETPADAPEAETTAPVQHEEPVARGSAPPPVVEKPPITPEPEKTAPIRDEKPATAGKHPTITPEPENTAPVRDKKPSIVIKEPLVKTEAEKTPPIRDKKPSQVVNKEEPFATAPLDSGASSFIAVAANNGDDTSLDDEEDGALRHMTEEFFFRRSLGSGSGGGGSGGGGGGSGSTGGAEQGDSGGSLEKPKISSSKKKNKKKNKLVKKAIRQRRRWRGVFRIRVKCRQCNPDDKGAGRRHKRKRNLAVAIEDQPQPPEDGEVPHEFQLWMNEYLNRQVVRDCSVDTTETKFWFVKSSQNVKHV